MGAMRWKVSREVGGGVARVGERGPGREKQSPGCT